MIIIPSWDVRLFVYQTLVFNPSGRSKPRLWGGTQKVDRG
jgi:hypothetical protein